MALGRWLLPLVLAASVVAQKPDAHRNLVYTADSTGSVQRSVGDRLDERLSVKDFGAVGDGTNDGGGTDDTAAIQACLDLAISVRMSCYVPPGLYNITGLTIAGSANLIGDTSMGYGQPALVYTGTGTALTIGNGTDIVYAVNLTNIGIRAANGVTGAIGINTRKLSGGDWQGVVIGGAATTGKFTTGLRLSDSGILNMRRPIISNQTGVTGSTGILFDEIGATGNAHIIIDGGDFFHQNTMFDVRHCDHCVIKNSWVEGFDYLFKLDGSLLTGSLLDVSDMLIEGNTFLANLAGTFANRKLLYSVGATGKTVTVYRFTFDNNRNFLAGGVDTPLVINLASAAAGSLFNLTVRDGYFPGTETTLISADSNRLSVYIDGAPYVRNAAVTSHTSFATGSANVYVQRPRGTDGYPLIEQTQAGAINIRGSSSESMSRPAAGARTTGVISGTDLETPANDNGFVRVGAGGGYSAEANAFCDWSGYSAVSDMNRNIVCMLGTAETLRMSANGVRLLGSANSYITGILSATAALNFSAPGAVPGCTADLTITVTGVSVGDAVALGVPTSGLTAAFLAQATVSNTDTVSVRWCQFSGAPADPDGAGGTYRANVVKH